ncbi:hypothetical protein HU200_028967 [Digitaria exilis]|uniref:Uncharacterized protein n=1 Tax=Digitaria exilis TaxID=1010633 RepID=A0A835BUI2_9POAL|nr:hypothetical protein HU200_028967 [Digitaria exilis]
MTRLEARKDFNSRIFKEVVIIAAWAIWTHRNEVIFYRAHIALRRWKQLFRDEFSLLLHRAKQP